MNVVSAETIRRLLPGLAVLAVLAFSFFAASPSLASSTNNCGVKGYGYHDHGKVCPNRPFPGHGFGVLAKLGTGLAPSESSATTTAQIEAKVHSNTNVTANASGSSESSKASKSHGHGNGHARGRPAETE